MQQKQRNGYESASGAFLPQDCLFSCFATKTTLLEHRSKYFEQGAKYLVEQSM
jgi:hypothetical protein